MHVQSTTLAVVLAVSSTALAGGYYGGKETVTVKYPVTVTKTHVVTNCPKPGYQSYQKHNQPYHQAKPYYPAPKNYHHAKPYYPAPKGYHHGHKKVYKAPYKSYSKRGAESYEPEPESVVSSSDDDDAISIAEQAAASIGKRGSEAPGYGYQAPAYGYQAPAYGYQAPAYGYQAPGYGYSPYGYGPEGVPRNSFPPLSAAEKAAGRVSRRGVTGDAYEPETVFGSDDDDLVTVAEDAAASVSKRGIPVESSYDPEVINQSSNDEDLITVAENAAASVTKREFESYDPYYSSYDSPEQANVLLKAAEEATAGVAKRSVNANENASVKANANANARVNDGNVKANANAQVNADANARVHARGTEQIPQAPYYGPPRPMYGYNYGYPSYNYGYNPYNSGYYQPRPQYPQKEPPAGLDNAPTGNADVPTDIAADILTTGRNTAKLNTKNPLSVTQNLGVNTDDATKTVDTNTVDTPTVDGDEDNNTADSIINLGNAADGIVKLGKLNADAPVTDGKTPYEANNKVDGAKQGVDAAEQAAGAVGA